MLTAIVLLLPLSLYLIFLGIAPTPTVRGTPAGLKLKDGYRTTLTLADSTTISLWEKSLKPIGIDGGAKIDQTTMFNVEVETAAPQALMALTDGSAKAAYDPNVYNQMFAEINRNQVLTVTFPDGSTLAFWGFVQKYEPNEITRGKQPEADIVVVCTNLDASGAEFKPVLTSVSGT